MDKKVVIGIVIILAIILLAFWAFSGPSTSGAATTAQQLPSMVGGC